MTEISDLVKMAGSSPKPWKTLWEKEKLLVTSNFSFSHCVFKRLVLQTCKNQGLFGKGLTLYHTVLTLNDPEEETFRKQCGKRRKCCEPAFSPFPTPFSTLPKTNFNFSVTFILSSASVFNLEQSKYLLFGKELNYILFTAQSQLLTP